MRKKLKAILRESELVPVLLDIGASAGAPKLWSKIGKYSKYIAFDPDARDFEVSKSGLFLEEILIDAAVVEQDIKETAFYLTKSPHCSSMLKPNNTSLDDYAFGGLFELSKEVRVKGITLNEVARKWNISTFDWVKIDSQGADLRLFESISDKLSDLVLALDVEPGLMPAYCEEDTFVKVHSSLLANGFWASKMNIKGSPRINQKTLRDLKHKKGFMGTLIAMLGSKENPHWCEARYLRTPEWVLEHGGGKRELLLLWIFAMLDSQYGFAYQVGICVNKNFECKYDLCRIVYGSMLKEIVFFRWTLSDLWRVLRDIKFIKG